MTAIKLTVDGTKLAEVAANLALAYERLNLAIDALERASGIEFRDRIAADFRADRQS